MDMPVYSITTRRRTSSGERFKITIHDYVDEYTEEDNQAIISLLQ